MVVVPTSLALCGLLILLIGLGTLWNDPRRLVNRLFCVFTAGFALWSLSLALVFLYRDFLYNQLVLFTVLPVFGGLFLFVLAYPNKEKLPWQAYAGLIPIGFLTALIPFRVIISGVAEHADGFVTPINGPAMPIFAIILLYYTLLSAAVFVIRFHKMEGRERTQMWYLATALALCFGIASIGDLVLPAFGIFSFVLLGPLSLIVFTAIISYAIVRHELMDIKVVIKRGLVYATVLVLTVSIYLTLVGAMGYFFGSAPYTLFLSAALTVVVGAFGVPLFQRARMYKEAQRNAQELERKVEERTRQLREMQESQAQMMLDISHGLQTPLAVFQTKLEQLKQTIPNDKDLRQLEASLADVSNFIYALLQLAHLENNPGEIARSPLCLSSLFEEAIEEIETIAAMHTINVRKDIAAEIYVSADAEKLRDVIMNLASNSIKYMRQGGKREISFSLATANHLAILSVSDTGIGIAQEDLPHIFERFYRVQNSSQSIQGTGLGLAISKHIVEQHHGTLLAQSERGIGTTMTLQLPTLPV